MTYIEVKKLINNISFSIFNQKLNLNVFYDKKYRKYDISNNDHARLYLQISYEAPCTKTGKIEKWKGGKHYLSSYMTEDEIVKKAYVAFEAAIKHEIMEGFKFNNIIVFNPHVNFRELLKISHKEVKRK